MPAFSLPRAPPEVTLELRRPWKAPLPLDINLIRRFGVMLSPVNCRRMST